MVFFCWSIRRLLGAYHDGELGHKARARVEAHLTRCRVCTSESASLRRVQALLHADVAAPPEAVWEVFWPQVRMRLQAPPAAEPHWRRAWQGVTAQPRLVFGSALAAAALAGLAVLAPWQRLEQQAPVATSIPGVESALPPGGGPTAGTPPAYAVVQSVETADPQSSVMVYTNPESDVTVVWVFGLENTET